MTNDRSNRAANGGRARAAPIAAARSDGQPSARVHRWLLRRLTAQLVPAIGIDSRGTRTPDVALRESRVRAVGFFAQEFLADKRVQNRAARLLLDSAKTMHLFGRETQTWHFEELGAETFEDRLHMTSFSEQRH
jgi:hypothetical protein